MTVKEQAREAGLLIDIKRLYFTWNNPAKATIPHGKTTLFFPVTKH